MRSQMLRRCGRPALLALALLGLGGCVYYPGYGYYPATTYPAYGYPAYGYYPGVAYAGPVVVGGGWGWHGGGWWHH
jgi:hypothetical protein